MKAIHPTVPLAEGKYSAIIYANDDGTTTTIRNGRPAPLTYDQLVPFFELLECRLDRLALEGVQSPRLPHASVN